MSTAFLPPLINAPELAACLRDPTVDLLLLDARFNLQDPAAGAAAWAAGHVPGARHADLDRDLSGTKTGRNGRHPLPTTDAFAATARAWGLNPETRVVVYDAQGGMFAARLWWMLRWLGHDAVQVLDGGLPAWQSQGGRLDTTAPAARAPGRFVPTPRTDWLVDAASVLDALDAPGTQQLIDARAPDRFRGENETLDPVGGHIPGARNRFFQHNLTPEGRFKDPAVLRAEFRQVIGDTPLFRIVHQCGSGVTACHNLLALAHAGLPDSRLYAGSWSEWCADRARPVATGA
jgi:thiosulfate/3-mercaptopyruvate sulfurtransferase